MSCRNGTVLPARLLIADEPTTALDVTIQAQILQLLKQLNENEQMNIILITHDLGVVASLAKRIEVMYGGLIMEEGTTEEIFEHPTHPYTRALLHAIPKCESRMSGTPRTDPWYGTVSGESAGGMSICDPLPVCM